jgi:hypothetical protein
MKKLLIFGDSFGEEFALGFGPNFPYHNEHKNLISYTQILRESNVFSSIENYAFGGSDLWWQYKIFLEKYTGDENVLWLLTNPNRITLENPDNPGGAPFTVVGLNFSEFQLDRIRSGKEPNYSKSAEVIYNAAVEYYKHLIRDDYDEFVYETLINKISDKAKENVWFIPCFKTKRFPDFSLLDVFIKESTALDYVVSRDQNKYIDIRRNHLTEENHKVLAKQIIDYYTTGKQLDPSLFVVPSKKDFDKYIKPR